VCFVIIKKGETVGPRVYFLILFWWLQTTWSNLVTNQVLVFISLQGSRDWRYPILPRKKFLKVDSKKGFKLGRSKAWILKKRSWWRLEESVTLCKILECLSFNVELMLKNHTHLHKLTDTKNYFKKVSKTMFFTQTVDNSLELWQACRQVLFRELLTCISSI